PYDEIAEMCSVSEENARQLVHRAQEKLQRPRARFEASDEQKQRLLDAFLDASGKQDATRLKELLHDDVIRYSDGGGKAQAAMVPVHGRDKLIHFLINVVKGAIGNYDIKPALVNGAPGALLINRETRRVDTVCTLEVEGGSITGGYLLRKPDKIFL